MKKLSLISKAIILIITLTSCGITKGDPSQLDNIEINQIAVKMNSSASVKLGDRPQNVITSMGTPTNSYSEYWEMSEKDALIYDYNGTKFNFLDNRLESYELSSPVYLVGNTSTGIFFNVESSLGSVSSYLPNWSSKKNDGTLSANITNGGQQTDKFIYIEFNPSTEIITKISISSY